MTFVFLFEDGESPGERIARCAEQALADGPMGNFLDGERYESFLAVWEREHLLRSVRTSCAVFASAVLGWCGKPLKRPWKADGTWGITSWLGLSFKNAAWVWAEDAVPEVGAVFYRDYNRQTTPLGHVGVFTQRHDDGLWTTAEGGGGLGLEDSHKLTTAQAKATSGTVCRLSKPKDVRAKDSLGRVLIGWWKPDLIELSEEMPAS